MNQAGNIHMSACESPGKMSKIFESIMLCYFFYHLCAQYTVFPKHPHISIFHPQNPKMPTK